MTRGSTPRVSVVIPVRDPAASLGECLRAISSQTLPHAQREVIVVLYEASEATRRIAREQEGVIILDADRPGAGLARNVGVAAARGEWIAFTDSDCIPSRGWLRALLAAADNAAGDAGQALGAAGLTIGHQSHSAAARFVDLTGGLQAERHLAHPRYPWAPTSNVLYRRAALNAVGGFDARFTSYEGCDLHTRLVRFVGGRFDYVAHAVVHHRHRSSWRAYWRQQLAYGRGFGQFFRRYESELRWTPGDEVRAWISVGLAGARAVVPAAADQALVRRGTFVKQLAQRIGFVRTYWNPAEAVRWRNTRRPPVGAREFPRAAPWWSPWGFGWRMWRTIRRPSDVVWLVRIGWFVMRLPGNVERQHLGTFLRELASARRPAATDPTQGADRIARLRKPWLRLPGLRSRDTCYVRALTLYRFLDPAGHDVELRVGAEWFDRPGGALRGHAWVTLDGRLLEGPPEADDHERLQLIDLGAGR